MAYNNNDESATTADNSISIESELSEGSKPFEASRNSQIKGRNSIVAPEDIAPVAWMVIIGDSIHNFSDGLIIGAAFSAGIVKGISTAIAVFFHELPHEFGDFAVLLRAGMTVRMAATYNLLSGLVSIIGAAIGCAVGNIDGVSTWIFAAVAGMFLYIALCDLLPEIQELRPAMNENPFVHLIFQNSGILLGIVLMVLMAIYEKPMEEMLTSAFEGRKTAH